MPENSGSSAFSVLMQIVFYINMDRHTVFTNSWTEGTVGMAVLIAYCAVVVIAEIFKVTAMKSHQCVEVSNNNSGVERWLAPKFHQSGGECGAHI